MKTAWSPAKEVTIKALEANLFTIQAYCLGDWLKIEKEGPWLFRQNAVIIVPYDGLVAAETVDLNFIEVWVQIHKLPVGYREKPLITNLVKKKIGEVKEVEINIPGINNFVRVRVKLDVRKALARFVTVMRGGQREFYQIKFEKFPKFCGACGFLGHTHLECGTGEHDVEKLKWGDWLKADWDTWKGRNFSGTRGGARVGRGDFGRGTRGRNQAAARGDMRSWRHNALQYVDGTAMVEDHLSDSGSSPIKPNDLASEDRGSADSGVKRRLLLQSERQCAEEDEILEEEGNLAVAMVMDESGMPIVSNTEEVEADRKKRTKKAGADSPSLGSAGSLERPVRSQ
jgi:hypothetical protein